MASSVRVKNPFEFLPDLGPDQSLSLAGDFLVAFQQLDAHPSERQPFQGKPIEQRHHLVEHLLVRRRMEGFCGG